MVLLEFGAPVRDDFGHGDDDGHAGEIAVAAPLEIPLERSADLDVDREAARAGSISSLNGDLRSRLGTSNMKLTDLLGSCRRE